MSLGEVLEAIAPLDDAAAAEAEARQATLTKPPGSLGDLERLGSRLSAIAGRCPPPVPEAPVAVVFAGDHGVLREGVSPWPAEVTAQMVANFLAGGAAVNVIAAEVGASVVVVDVGVATPVPVPPAGALGRFVEANVRKGTDNLVVGPAMSLGEAREAVETGLSLVTSLIDEGADLVVPGDMGIGNTTPSAALIAAITGRLPREVTGRGTGISDEALELKVAAVEAGLRRAASAHCVAPEQLSSLSADVLVSEVGGVEIAAIAGAVLGAAARRVPVVVDGVISLAGTLLAVSLAPEAAGYVVAGHRSVEPGAKVALDHLGLEPLLDLQLRLGEGTGGCLAVPLVRAAARILSAMSTFESAGVSGAQGV